MTRTDPSRAPGALEKPPSPPPAVSQCGTSGPDDSRRVRRRRRDSRRHDGVEMSRFLYRLGGSAAADVRGGRHRAAHRDVRRTRHRPRPHGRPRTARGRGHRRRGGRPGRPGRRASGIGRTDVRIPTYNRSMPELVAPPGWPRQVRPPGAPGWERTAVAWLLDVCPPEYRSYPALRRHDVILARFAVLHVEACQAAVQRGLSGPAARCATWPTSTRWRPRSRPGRPSPPGCSPSGARSASSRRRCAASGSSPASDSRPGTRPARLRIPRPVPI